MACCQLVFHILRYRRSVVSEDVHVLKQSADTGRLGTSATKQTTASPNALKTEQNGSITSNKPPIATLPDNTPIRLRHPNHRFIAFFYPKHHPHTALTITQHLTAFHARHAGHALRPLSPPRGRLAGASAALGTASGRRGRFGGRLWRLGGAAKLRAGGGAVEVQRPEG